MQPMRGIRDVFRIERGRSAWVAAILLAGALSLASAVHGQGVEPRNLGFEDLPETAGGSPPGWSFTEHAGKTSFEFAIDDQVVKEGKHSVRIKRTGTQPFGLLSQWIKADRFRGKRARFSAFLRLDNVEPFGRGGSSNRSGAVLILRSGVGGGVLTFNDMRDHPLLGTMPWTEVSVELDVPPMADTIEFGAMLRGSGTLWVDAAKLEVVAPSTGSAASAK